MIYYSICKDIPRLFSICDYTFSSLQQCYVVRATDKDLAMLKLIDPHVVNALEYIPETRISSMHQRWMEPHRIALLGKMFKQIRHSRCNPRITDLAAIFDAPKSMISAGKIDRFCTERSDEYKLCNLWTIVRTLDSYENIDRPDLLLNKRIFGSKSIMGVLADDQYSEYMLTELLDYAKYLQPDALDTVW